MANYFFDSSALIKLYHPELGSQRIAAVFGEPDRRVIISRLAGVELHSALALKTRTGHLAGAAAARSFSTFIRVAVRL